MGRQNTQAVQGSGAAQSSAAHGGSRGVSFFSRMLAALPEGTPGIVVTRLALAAIDSGVAGDDSIIALAESVNAAGGLQQEAVFGGIALFSAEETADELEGDGMRRAPEWIEVIPAPLAGAMPGHVETRDYRKGFLVESPQSIVDKFNAEPAERRRKPIDWDHLLHRNWDAKRCAAAGWMVELEVRGSAVWARVEWTPEGREDVRLKRFAYISPVVAVEWPANSEGQIDWDAVPRAVELLDAALTNNPATYIRSLAETPLPEGEPPAPVTEASMVVREPMAAHRFAASRSPTPLEPDMKITPAMFTAIGLPASASESEFEAALTQRLAATPDPAAIEQSIMAKVQLVLADARQTAASEAKAVMAAENAKDLALVKVESLVNQAIADRKIVPSQRESMIEFGVATSPEKLATMISTFAVHQLATPAAVPSTPAVTVQTLSADDLAICEQLGLTPAEFTAARDKQGAAPKSRKRSAPSVDDEDDDD